MQEWQKPDMQYPEEAFASCALIALKNREIMKQRRLIPKK
jgi:hypothetical protein